MPTASTLAAKTTHHTPERRQGIDVAAGLEPAEHDERRQSQQAAEDGYPETDAHHPLYAAAAANVPDLSLSEALPQ